MTKYNMKPEFYQAEFRKGRDKGLTYDQIAKGLGITTGTLYKWLSYYPELKAINEKTHESKIDQLENALFKRAMGYEYTETTTEAETDSSGNVVRKHIKNVKKFMPPSETALIFMLTNLDNKKWKRNPDDSNSENEQKQDVVIE